MDYLAREKFDQTVRIPNEIAADHTTKCGKEFIVAPTRLAMLRTMQEELGSNFLFTVLAHLKSLLLCNYVHRYRRIS